MLSDKANRWFAIFTVLIMFTTTLSAKTRVAKQPFGHTPEGTPVEIYSLADGKIEVGIMTYGGIIVRYANRIAHGTFQLDGQTYSIPKNDGDNALHGGIRGFDKVVWTAKQIPGGVELTYVSKDGEEGFPGAL